MGHGVMHHVKAIKNGVLRIKKKWLRKDKGKKKLKKKNESVDENAVIPYIRRGIELIK